MVRIIFTNVCRWPIQQVRQNTMNNSLAADGAEDAEQPTSPQLRRAGARKRCMLDCYHEYCQS